jgi:hypothetical protein
VTTSTRCPNAHLHTDGPAGYVAWHEWAEQMATTHHCGRCPGCGLFVIWMPMRQNPVVASPVPLGSCGHPAEQLKLEQSDGSVMLAVLDGPCSQCWLDEDDDYRRARDG